MEKTDLKFSFPQFRKMRGLHHFYRIDGPDRMSELIIREPWYQYIETRARVFPDRLLIADILNCRENRWEAVDEKDFSDILANAKKQWKELP